MIINSFIEMSLKNANKVAFLDYNKNYQDLLDDIFKMISLYEKKLQKGKKVLMMIPLSYSFYVSILAALIYGLEIIIIEDFKSQERLKEQIAKITPDFILTTKKTNILKKLILPFKNIKSIVITNYKKYTKSNLNMYQNNENISKLITFTSGTTKSPKAVIRSMNDLTLQINLTKSFLNPTIFNNNTKVLTTLPIYTLFCLNMGYSIGIYAKNIDKEIKRHNPQVIFSSIHELIKVKSAKSIKQVYVGGALISYFNAIKIKKTFNNAKINYIYGSTEVSLISISTIDEYLDNLEKDKICLGKICANNILEIDNIGEIIVKKGVITNNYLNEKKNESYHTSDYGYIEDGKIYLLGRIISKNPLIIADYYYEICLKRTFEIKQLAVIKKDSFLFVFIEKKDKKNIQSINAFLESKNKHYKVFVLKKLPLDYRHKTKIEYQKLLNESLL